MAPPPDPYNFLLSIPSLASYHAGYFTRLDNRCEIILIGFMNCLHEFAHLDDRTLRGDHWPVNFSTCPCACLHRSCVCARAHTHTHVRLHGCACERMCDTYSGSRERSSIAGISGQRCAILLSCARSISLSLSLSLSVCVCVCVCVCVFVHEHTYTYIYMLAKLRPSTKSNSHTKNHNKKQIPDHNKKQIPDPSVTAVLLNLVTGGKRGVSELSQAQVDR